jgi:hypothetical protein
MKYYWVTVDFELNGNDYSDRFLFKHKTEISEENALERYILECVDFDAICEDGVWITDKGNTRELFVYRSAIGRCFDHGKIHQFVNF